MRELYYNIDLDIAPLIDMNLPSNVRHSKILYDNINPQLHEILASVKLSISSSGIFYASPGFKTDIMHVDCHIEDPTSDWPSIAKLNFVVGAPDTITMWGDVPIKYRLLSKSTQTDISQPYQSYNIRRCENIEIYKLNGCFLFEAGIPHTISNPTQNQKWTISFILHNPGSWDVISFKDAKDRLSRLCLQR